MKKNKLVLGMVAVFVVIAVMALVITFSSEKKWVQNGTTIKKGIKSFEVGDYYDYDETNGGKIKDLIDVKWKVLGVDDDGNLLIVSASNVDNLTLGKEENLEVSQQDYIDGDTRLNEISQKYGKGKNAISARSISNNDIMKIMGIEADSLYQGFQNITYYWTDEINPKSVTEDGNSQIFKIEHKGIFVLFDKESSTWSTSVKTGNETSENPVKIATLDNDLLAFNNLKYNETTNEYIPIIDSDNSIYKMLFLDDEGNKAVYWTSDKFINATERYVFYGYNAVKGSDLNYAFLVYSHGFTRENTYGVRAVITIN